MLAEELFGQPETVPNNGAATLWRLRVEAERRRPKLVLVAGN